MYHYLHHQLFSIERIEHNESIRKIQCPKLTEEAMLNNCDLVFCILKSFTLEMLNLSKRHRFSLLFFFFEDIVPNAKQKYSYSHCYYVMAHLIILFGHMGRMSCSKKKKEKTNWCSSNETPNFEGGVKFSLFS